MTMVGLEVFQTIVDISRGSTDQDVRGEGKTSGWHTRIKERSMGSYGGN